MRLSKQDFFPYLISPPLAGLTILAILAGGLAFLTTSSLFLSELSTVVVLVATIFVVYISRVTIPDIQVTCLQDSQFSSIEDLHNLEYFVYDSYAKLDVFVEIPQWMDGFEIVIKSNGPFSLELWTPPNVSDKNNVLYCNDYMNGFNLEMQIFGNHDRIGEASYDLEFVDAKTGRCAHKVKLHTKDELPQVDEDELSEEEAEEWGIEPAPSAT